MSASRRGRGWPAGYFIEVEPVVVEAVSERIEVALSNGRVVRVPMTFRDDALARVLAAAERA